MKFLLDQNLSPETTAFVRRLGYDAVDVRELEMVGAEDARIMERAQVDGRVVITFNGDFADISEFPLGTHYGVIRLRIFPQTFEILHPILERQLAELEKVNVEGCLVIIDNWRVRIKRR